MRLIDRATGPSGCLGVGVCRRCGVRFAGRPHHRLAVLGVLRAHESVCPGGDRDAEWAAPYEALASGRLSRKPDSPRQPAHARARATAKAEKSSMLRVIGAAALIFNLVIPR